LRIHFRFRRRFLFAHFLLDEQKKMGGGKFAGFMPLSNISNYGIHPAVQFSAMSSHQFAR
jgi:hypothetical protein